MYLGGPRTTVDGEVILLGESEVRHALATGRVEQLAYLAVALNRLWGAETYQWTVAEAVAKSLADE